MKAALIIAEDPTVRTFFNRALGYRGWWVDAVGSIESGLAQLQLMPRDLVLLDWHAEAGTALVMLLLIRSHTKWHRVRVVMLHNGLPEEIVEIALLAGADGCLKKPDCRGPEKPPPSGKRGNCYCGSVQIQPVAESVYLFLPQSGTPSNRNSPVPLEPLPSVRENATLDSPSANRPHFPHDTLATS